MEHSSIQYVTLYVSSEPRKENLGVFERVLPRVQFVHRRELHIQLTRQADVAKRNKQLLEQKEQMEQAQRNAPRDDGGELPQRQDQEARTDPLEQGFTEGQ